jgi:aryl-alcohol dehydrogenase-like predicted oxidoreductase
VIIATRIALARPVIGGVATYAELIRGCAQDSIRRIGCGFLDFLVVEWTDAIVPIDESVAALRAVIASGEIRYVVPANFPTPHAREALTAFKVAPRLFAGLQFDYSLANRPTFESEAEALCVDGALGLVARLPFADGLLARRPLTSIFGAFRCRPASERPAAIVARTIWPILIGNARSSRSSPKVALAWLLAHPQVTTVIVNVRSVSQLRELITATRLPLTDQDIARSNRPLARSVTTTVAR